MDKTVFAEDTFCNVRCAMAFMSILDDPFEKELDLRLHNETPSTQSKGPFFGESDDWLDNGVATDVPCTDNQE